MRLASALEAAARRDPAAVLAVARQVTGLLERYGAYQVRRDWSDTTRELVERAAAQWREGARRADPERHVESLVKNAFWAEVIEAMVGGDARAAGLFYPTLRRLLASWDRGRQLEAAWDDVVQDTAQQIWEAWRAGGVERPWSLLYTIARRRFLDRLRARRPEDELPEERTADEDGPGAMERAEPFAAAALETLEVREREVVVLMDLEGHTRLEIARKLGLSEGEVLSIRRAGLRRLWRWLGRDLPPALRGVWEEMFKGARRATPEQVAGKLGLEPGEVAGRIAEARALLGLESLG